MQRHKGVWFICIGGVWCSNDKLWKSVLFFYHLGPGDWTQVIRLSGEHLYLINHLPKPLLSLFTVVRDANIYNWPRKTMRPWALRKQ